MKKTGKTGKIAAVACLVLLAAAVLEYLVLGGKSPVLTGAWYGYDDNENLSVLTLNGDGTYIINGTFIEIAGSYTASKSTIEMKDRYGYAAGEMQLGKNEAGEIVTVAADYPKISYFRTLEEANADVGTASLAEKERILFEKYDRIMFISSAEQILIKGDWKYENSFGLSRLSFTEDTFTVTFESETRSYAYEITDVVCRVLNEGTDVYIIKWTVKHNGLSFDKETVSIVMKDYMEYRISSPLFPFSQVFHKTGAIYIEQPDVYVEHDY